MKIINKLRSSPDISQKLRLAIVVSFSLFGLNLLLYIYNPYYLMRPLQIKEDNNVNQIHSSASDNNIHSVPDEIFDLLDIVNKPSQNFSVTKSSRRNLFLKGIGNCAQQSTGMGIVLDSLGYNYSIIHFLPKTGLYEGSGHTILMSSLDSISFLVDPINKMIPIVKDGMHDMRLMNIADLFSQPNIDILNSNKRVTKFNNLFWAPDFIIAYAEVSRYEMNEYFGTSKLIVGFLRLDESKFSRIFVNGITAIFWRLPTFKVTHDNYINICLAYPNFIFLKYLAYFFICNIYSLISLVFVYVIMGIINKI